MRCKYILNQNLGKMSKLLSFNLHTFLSIIILLICLKFSVINCDDFERTLSEKENLQSRSLENSKINLFIPEVGTNFNASSNGGNLSTRSRRRHVHHKRNRTVEFDSSPKDGNFNWAIDDFVMRDILPDGERETRIRFGGIRAKETAAVSMGSGLILRQLAEGRHFVQTISNAAGKIIDCEYLKDKETVQKFVKDFNREIGSCFVKNKKSDDKKRRKVKYKRNFTTKGLVDRDEKNWEKQRRKNRQDARDAKREFDVEEIDEFTSFPGLDKIDDVYRDDYKLLRRSRSKRDFYWDENDDLPDYSEFDPITSLNKLNLYNRYSKKRKSDGKISLSNRFDKTPLKNVTILKLDDTLPEGIANWLNYKTLKEECDKVHEQLKESLGLNDNKRYDAENTETMRRKSRSLLDGLIIVPGMLWCGSGDIAKSPKELGSFSEPDSCCRAHDLCPWQNMPSYTWRNGFFNALPYTLSNCKCDKSFSGRSKRAVSMLAPGTKWCGRGGSATRHSELGAFGRADRCCRKHDTTCPFWIGAAQYKYGIFNWRPNTLMHCRCDERFRSCLKMAKTDAANMVGRLFFNVVQTKCFVIKTAKVCLDRSWWGKCLKTGYIKQAHLRDNPSF